MQPLQRIAPRAVDNNVASERRPRASDFPPPSLRSLITESPPSSRPPLALGGARRVLVIDDNTSIHEDFRKILTPPPVSTRGDRKLDALEAELFGGQVAARDDRGSFELFTATQGREGYEVASRMTRIGRPMSLAFVDMRMPPGWDGVETAAELWTVDPELEVVICSAYSDYSWQKVITKLKRPDLRLLRKPFETRDVLDLAWELTSRNLRRRGASRS